MENLTHAQEIESVRRQIFANEAEQRRLAIERPLKLHRAKLKAEQKRIADADIDRKIYNKIIDDRHSMKLPGDSTTGGTDAEMDEDTRLANELFLASGGGDGKAPLPDYQNRDSQNDTDDALAQSLFEASGGS